ncbi:hypothetical protein WJX73_005360 [Symbiochloris irregularis]|uniref:Zinc finger Mcm10/DnaG-type domain-containing protein n=1 Tax=Symbiochloris irregularis TaxID=706552 RepID=A0AAW1NTI7_9CHLO
MAATTTTIPASRQVTTEDDLAQLIALAEDCDRKGTEEAINLTDALADSTSLDEQQITALREHNQSAAPSQLDAPLAGRSRVLAAKASNTAGSQITQLHSFTEPLTQLKVEQSGLSRPDWLDQVSEPCSFPLGVLRSKLPLPASWLTAAVLLKIRTFSPPQVPAMQHICSLTDLAGNHAILKCPACPLGDAKPGSIFAIHDAEARVTAGDRLQLTVADAQKQIQSLGIVPTFAWCSARRQDGSRCGNAVDSSRARCCSVHDRKKGSERVVRRANRPELLDAVTWRAHGQKRDAGGQATKKRKGAHAQQRVHTSEELRELAEAKGHCFGAR